MTITQANYLDIGNLFINELVGSIGLAIILGIVYITYVGATQRLPAVVTVAFIFLWSGFILSIAYNSLLWILIIFVLGTLIYLLYAKMVKQ